MAKKKKYKYSHGGSHDTNLEKLKKGLSYVESSDGLKMMNPLSSATGFYGQLYNAEELQNMPYLQGVDRQAFASDTTLQNRLFEDRYFGKIPGVPGLGKNANDLRVEYKKVLEDKGIPFNYTDDEISALSNLLGRQGTREYFGYVLRDGRSLGNVFPKIYGPDPEAPNKTPEKYLETYREGRDLKYGGNMKKYQNGGDPPKKKPVQLQFDPSNPFNPYGDPAFSLQKYNNAITRDSTRLEDRLSPGLIAQILGMDQALLPSDYTDELGQNLLKNRVNRNLIKPYTKQELDDINYRQYGGKAIPEAGFGDMFKKLGNQVGAGLLGGIKGFSGGLIPTDRLVSDNFMSEYSDDFQMGSRAGTVGSILSGAGAFKSPTAAAAPSAASFSSVPGANSFNSIYGSGINPALMNSGLAGTSAGSSGFNNLLGAGTNYGVGNTASGMFNMFQEEQKGMAMGGRATNMKQDMGQDINVESGELLMSADGGQFQSMNPKAPIKELMPGVSMVQGKQSNDNVPIKIPDGETMVFSKRLGYADKGLDLIEQYKSLESSEDPTDFIGQQTKKFQLKRIKDKLQKLFKEQEGNKSKKIAKSTGTENIPTAGLGDLFTKDNLKLFGNKAFEFAKNNPEAIYNFGMGVGAKDIPQIDSSQYMTSYNPNPSLGKMDTGAILAPINNQVNAARYSINQSGGSPGEIIAGNMALNAKAAPQLASAEAKGQNYENQLGLNIFNRQSEIDRNNKLLALRLNMMNEQRGAARNAFFKEGIQDLGQYQGATKQEDFLQNLYEQRFGTPTTTGGGAGTGFNFSLGDMAQPSLSNFGLFDNYQGLNQ